VTTSSAEGTQFLRDRQPASVPIWLEALAGLDWLALRCSAIYWGCGVPRGDGAPVVVVPGFLGSDAYLEELSWWLDRMGYRAYRSRIGRNAECLDLLVTRLVETIETAHRETGRKVHLIGHSLGGMLSRAATVLHPELVASVTVLGSPFRGIRSHPLVLEMSERVRARIQVRNRADGRDEQAHCYTGYCGCETVSAFLEGIPDSIPSIAIYTRTDGVVDWRFCVNDDPATNFEVTGTHVGLAFNPQVFSLIATQLAAARL
jgi:triacylglycerol lipase